MNHTPGPWSVEVRDNELQIWANWPEGGHVHNRQCVAVVNGRVNPNYDMEPLASDARLIAAAPELLEALKAFLKYSEGTVDTSDNCVAVEDAARAALAKVGL